MTLIEAAAILQVEPATLRQQMLVAHGGDHNDTICVVEVKA